VVALDSGAGLANATLQQRLVPVRLFFDFLVEEGVRESNPVGRGRYTPSVRGARALDAFPAGLMAELRCRGGTVGVRDESDPKDL
jgi:site-specific recombinase XerC